MEVGEDEEGSATGEDEEDSVTVDEEDSEEEGVAVSDPRTVEDFGAEEVAEVPQEGGEEAEEALERGGRSWLSHTDMKECSSAEGRRTLW